MKSKASVQVGYSRSDPSHYHDFHQANLAGADILMKDGKGNTIEVNVREGDVGYRITLNGSVIAEG